MKSCAGTHFHFIKLELPVQHQNIKRDFFFPAELAHENVALKVLTVFVCLLITDGFQKTAMLGNKIKFN